VIEKTAVMEFLRKRAGQLDGVVLTGGEPTLQSDLLPFIKEIKEFGYKVKLDTNGSSPRVIEEAPDNNLCDYFAVEYKAPSNRYQEICRGAADADTVLHNIRILLDYGADFKVRTTVIPQLTEDDLLQMALELPVVPRYTLNRYRAPEKFLHTDEAKVMKKPYSEEMIAAFTENLRAIQPNVMI
jgi:pyruvate formate lyase activating enzyme